MLYACAKLSQESRVLVLIFVNKIFVIGKPFTKITKIFLLEIFQLYGSVTKILRKIHATTFTEKLREITHEGDERLG